MESITEPFLDKSDQKSTPPYAHTNRTLPSDQHAELVPWQIIFFLNVFLACVSFSIVMPSLWLYLHSMKASRPFYAAVVAIYSVGEAIGSIALGSLSNAIGIRRTLMLCIIIAFSGAAAYALADLAQRLAPTIDAPLIVLAGRLLQGIGSGGQQAVEQAYLSVAAPPEQRTELTGRLSTFACLGFIFGPALGAAVSQLPQFAVGALRFTSFTMQGWFMALSNLVMFAFTLCFIERTRDAPPPASSPSLSAAPMTPHRATATPAAKKDSSLGIWACIAFFFVHFNGFAVQETITTPLVQDWFHWDALSANLLFVAAGVMNLLCAVVLAIASAPMDGGDRPRVEDRKLLVCSLATACAGWALIIPAGKPSVPQFLVAYTLVTVAFPFGRGVCLAMVGKLLGDEPQGGWMGIMFALGAIARILGPFWAVHGYFAIGPFAVFGSTSAIFAASLCATLLLWRRLAPPPGVHFAKRKSQFYDAVDMSTPHMSPHVPHYHVDGGGTAPPAIRLPETL